ncbi:MAG: Holliday junction branch migration protein RuvA [Armatimonadota bacterium]|nr:Holliday junction branch migration protein RuvA [bacterium]MDW8320980.1 Holliday junction branch migration protein RuvA [Armatimonadota bacterium]
MIAHVRGTLVEKDTSAVVVDVNGVGYRVLVPETVSAALPTVGEQVHLLTTFYVREEEMSLYGFVSADQRRLFEMLISVSGVGPKAALSLLSVMDAEQLAMAIAAEDIKRLTGAPGVGAKIAQRIAIELKDKAAEIAWERKVDRLAARGKPLPSDRLEDAVEALMALGYNRTDARRAVETAAKSLAPDAETAALVRSALQVLTTGR